MPAQDGNGNDTPDAGAPPARKGGLVMPAALGAIVFAAAAGSAFLFAPSLPADIPADPGEHSKTPAPQKKADGKHAGKKSAHGKKDAATEDAGYEITSLDNETSFFSLDPLVVTIRPIEGAQHLKVTIVLEIEPHAAAGLTASLPRVRDVLNTYLRSVAVEHFEDPLQMARLKEQILRRIRLAAGEPGVRSVLITEFILS